MKVGRKPARKRKVVQAPVKPRPKPNPLTKLRAQLLVVEGIVSQLNERLSRLETNHNALLYRYNQLEPRWPTLMPKLKLRTKK